MTDDNKTTPSPAPGLDLDAVERAERAMTPGPWLMRRESHFVQIRAADLEELATAEQARGVDVANAAGIVALRNAAPALIAEMAAARAEIARLTAELERSEAKRGVAEGRLAVVQDDRNQTSERYTAILDDISRVVERRGGEAVTDAVRRVAAELAAARAVPGDVEALAKEAVDGALEAGRCSALGHAYLLTKDPAYTVPRLMAAIARALSDATAAAVGEFIDSHARRLCESLGETWTGMDGQADGWAAAIHDVLNHLRADEDGAIHDGRAAARGTVGGMLATAPRCSCTHEAGDSRCDAHPTCSECGEPTPRPVDGCDACRGPLPKGG